MWKVSFATRNLNPTPKNPEPVNHFYFEFAVEDAANRFMDFVSNLTHCIGGNVIPP